MPAPESNSSKATSGKWDYSGLDRVLHEKARLGIMTSLVANRDGLSFTDLKDLCGLTDGNLNRHLETLCAAGHVEIRKESHGRRTRTMCRVTAQGRASFLAYLSELERVVATAAKAVKATGARVGRRATQS